MKKISTQGLILGILLVSVGAIPLLPRDGFAQTKKQNPLQSTTPDPLLPQRSIERPFSPLERYRLETSLEQLNNEATDLFNAGNLEQAFQVWYREIRLRRELGPIEEVTALGRVGEMAWRENRKEDVQLITQRLETIQKESAKNSALLTALGKAYQQIRVPKLAVVVYQEILTNAEASRDIEAQQSALETIGTLHLAWFDYTAAAETYERLLELARSHSDSFNEVNYLQQLSYIYTQLSEPENAVKVKETLLQEYQNTENFEQLAALKIAIADDYKAINDPEKASQSYQEAFALAWKEELFSQASEALQKLGDLYREYEQPEYALQVYQELVKVHQQAYNYYGLMNTYDQMGQIYLVQQDYSQALIVFEKGLEIAQSLSYQEAYFDSQIAAINQEIQPNPSSL